MNLATPSEFPQVSGDAANVRALATLANGVLFRGNTRFRAPVNQNAHAFFRKHGSDGEPDARGRAGHYGLLTLQSQIHPRFPLCGVQALESAARAPLWLLQQYLRHRGASSSNLTVASTCCSRTPSSSAICRLIVATLFAKPDFQPSRRRRTAGRLLMDHRRSIDQPARPNKLFCGRAAQFCHTFSLRRASHVHLPVPRPLFRCRKVPGRSFAGSAADLVSVLRRYPRHR